MTERHWASRLPKAVWDWLLAALLLVNVLTMWPPAEWPVAAGLTAALALPLVWRRRAPLAVFAAISTAAFVQLLVDIQLPADVALLVALYTVAANSSRRVTLVAVTVVEIGAVVACLRWATDGAFLTPLAALTAMVVAAAVLGVNDRTTRAYLEALGERAVAEERARITREMHDIVTHNLSVMVALTDAAVLAQPRSPDRATTAMLQVAETGRQALTDMRRSLGILRTDEPDAARHPLPGIAQLESLAGQMCAAGLPTGLDIDGSHAHIPATAQLTVYRLVQEALTNTFKHTPPGTRATVRIECAAETVTVDVTDTGPPASQLTSAGHGITGMRERSAGYGATLLAGPLPGGGWGVRTRLVLGGAA
ncbi:signal transduction histidine kinase [Actinokineospora baliensis]|uniref:sensor histidine kinase n=1 Tax=Actinokineospora baliensis TaxID=547056 RepID=UPI00195D046A|nr:histidine kinase [Actinokineospora baliensis]MBM7773267.1 signal transduction histidine kinase [Actinokineospora baliensis]